MSATKIIISQQDKIFFIKPEEIIFCQSDNGYTNVYLIENKKILIVKSLTKFHQELSSEDFIRVHQSYLLNKAYIQSINKKSHQIELENSHVIPFTVSIKELLSRMGKRCLSFLIGSAGVWLDSAIDKFF